MVLLCDISTASRPLLFRMLEAVRFTDNVVPAPHSLYQLGEWGANMDQKVVVWLYGCCMGIRAVWCCMALYGPIQQPYNNQTW